MNWPSLEVIDDCMQASGIRLDSNDGQFLRRVFSERPERYLRRLKRIGFHNRGLILDAGCGFGQWTVALAQLNHRVTAFDADSTRIQFLNLLLERLGILNVETYESKLPEIPRTNSFFDGIFCFGTVFLSPWELSLTNFASSLADGGLLFVNANDIGWHLYLFETGHNETRDYMASESLMHSLIRTSDYKRGTGTGAEKGQVIIKKAEFAHKLSELGLSVISRGEDGRAVLGTTRRRFLRTRFFPGTYKGFDAVHEVLAKREDVD